MGVGKKLVSLAAPPPNKEARFPIDELLARGGVEDAKYGASGVCQEPAAACFLTGRSDCSIESLEFGEMLVCGIQRPQVGVALTVVNRVHGMINVFLQPFCLIWPVKFK